MPDQPRTLTPRQTELIILLCNGASVREAAAAMGISWNTARATAEDIRERLGALTMPHAIAIWIRQGGRPFG